MEYDQILRLFQKQKLELNWKRIRISKCWVYAAVCGESNIFDIEIWLALSFQGAKK